MNNKICEDEYNFVNDLISIFENANINQIKSIIEPLFSFKIDNINDDDFKIKALIYLLREPDLYNTIDKKNKYYFKRFRKNIHDSLQSFSGKTLNSLDKNSKIYRNLFTQYMFLCLQEKCIYFLKKQNNKHLLICIDIGVDNGLYKHNNVRIYYLKEIYNSLYLTYNENYKTILELKDLTIGKLDGFNSIKQLHKIYSYEQLKKIYLNLKKIIPNQYCYFCNCDTNLLKSKSKKTQRCKICDSIFKNITETAPYSKEKLGAYKIFTTDLDHIVSNVKSYLEFLSEKNISPTPIEKKASVGHQILTYSKISKNRSLIDNKKELLNNVTAKNFLDLIAVIKAHYLVNERGEMPDYIRKIKS